MLKWNRLAVLAAGMATAGTVMAGIVWYVVTPTGPTVVSARQECRYTTFASSSPLAGAILDFEFDWGDGSPHTMVRALSGRYVSALHTWPLVPGTFPVRVQATMVYPETSNPSGWCAPLMVSMPILPGNGPKKGNFQVTDPPDTNP